MDIGYGDCKAIGGAKYCLLIVDRATRYTWIYALKSLTHEDITNALRDFKIDAGGLPTRIYTDFDNKLIAGMTAQWLKDNGDCKIIASLGSRQSQNGLVERAWQTISAMARSYITDMQMPRTYWYWGLRQAVHVINYFSCLVNGLSTTPFELVYGVKPDLRTLFRLFSVGYFLHESDGVRARDGISESKTMQGIAIGRSRLSDGMLFYSPITRKIYTSSDYKLDEGRSTPNLFNLHFDGGIFVGLYDHGNRTTVEPFPEGTPVLWPTTLHGKSVKMRGSVTSVPLPVDETLPDNADLESPYTIMLIDGSFHQVSPRRMDDIVDLRCVSPTTFSIPSWLGSNQKVMFLKDGSYLKGFMDYDTDRGVWRFIQRRRNGTEFFGHDFSSLSKDFQLLVDDGTLLPGWHSTATLNSALLKGSASHISAATLVDPHAPGSIRVALHHDNKDRHIWRDSYQEEYDGLISNNTFEVLSEEEYLALCRRHGTKAIPSMCVFTVKKDSSGRPLRAKSRIVVLGNKDPTQWTKADCYAPVASIPVVRLFTALAVSKRCTLKQGDCKNAFVQSTLPEDEITIVRPPSGCPVSAPHTYWRLRKSLYGLRRAPRHWFDLVSSHLTSPELGLRQCKNDPCVFVGSPVPGKPPLYLVIYVDDFLYFSEDPEVERYFEASLAQKITVDYMGNAEFFLGIKFDWNITSTSVDCRLSQEAYATTIVDELGLSASNTNSHSSPYRAGFPIDTIPHVDMSLEDRQPLIARVRSLLGMLNWLCICTRPDLTTCVSLLAQYQCTPSPGHWDAIKYIGRYLKSSADLGIVYSSSGNRTLESFVHFPVPILDSTGSPIPLVCCDANWGPQDASSRSPSSDFVSREVSLLETRSICGHVLFLASGPVLWKCHREKRTSRSSCEAEVKATDECTKSVQMFRHLLSEIGGFDLSKPTPILNDNQGAVDWCKTTSTKGMRHVNIRENCVREAIHEFHEIQVSHIPGKHNPSDIFTKEHKDVSTFIALRDTLLRRSPSLQILANGVLSRMDGGC